MSEDTKKAMELANEVDLLREENARWKSRVVSAENDIVRLKKENSRVHDQFSTLYADLKEFIDDHMPLPR